MKEYKVFHLNSASRYDCDKLSALLNDNNWKIQSFERAGNGYYIIYILERLK